MRRPTVPRVLPLPGGGDSPTSNVRQTLAHSAVVAAGMAAMGDAVLNRATTPRRLRELVILRMGWNCQSEYEFAQHRRIGLEHGLTPVEIEAVTRPVSAYAWMPIEATLLHMVDELHESDGLSDATWGELAAVWTTGEVLEFLAAALFYRLVSGILNSCGVPLDDGVPGWSGSLSVD